MSVRVLSDENSKPADVQRSTSLDFLNFEEKRQLIASSLSLSDFLQHRSNTAPVGTGQAPGKNCHGYVIVRLIASALLIHLTSKRKTFPEVKFGGMHLAIQTQT